MWRPLFFQPDIRPDTGYPAKSVSGATLALKITSFVSIFSNQEVWTFVQEFIETAQEADREEEEELFYGFSAQEIPTPIIIKV